MFWSLTEPGSWWVVRTEGHHILVLGGTVEARTLAEALAREPGFAVTYALFSPTGTVQPPEKCRLHLGSFGGSEGLVRFLAQERVSALVSALHPHAQTMQRRMDRVLPTLTIPTFRLQRRLWTPEPGDRWHEFESDDALIAAVRSVAEAPRLFCAIGPQTMQRFLPLTAFATVYARRFDQSRGEPDPAITWIDAQPHPSLADEIALFEGLGVDALITKNSGGLRPAKLDAANRLGLTVNLLRPPRDLLSAGYDRWEDIHRATLQALARP